MMIRVNHPEFGWRAGDYCLLAGGNPMRMFFHDLLDGWFSFGIPIDPTLEAYLGEGGRALLVWMDTQTRKPVAGSFIPVYAVTE